MQTLTPPRVAGPGPSAYEPPPLETPAPRPWRWTLTLDAELLAYGALFLAAVFTRFWDLGARALHHDESLHALYSWYLYVGRGYLHDPMMHGPFQFHGSALMYFLFGAGDATARTMAALFGITLVALPFLLRQELGRTGALITAALLTISPTMLYYSRFTREDIYVLVFNFLLAIALWRYVHTERVRYLVLAAAATALGFATKETTYITVAIFGAYLVLVNLPEIAIKARQRFDFASLSPRAGFMVLLGTLALPQAAAAATVLWKATGQPLEVGTTERMVVQAVSIGGLLAVSAVIGLRWNARWWLLGAAVFYTLYGVLFTTFFTNVPGFVSGIWGSLDYWLAQQDVRRGGQPWFYYLTLLPIYEFLPVAVMLATAAVRLRRRLLDLGLIVLTVALVMLDFALRDASLAGTADPLAPLPPATGILVTALGAATLAGVVLYRLRAGLQTFEGFCWFWLAGALIVYSHAGEKMPWLSVHLALPLVLLAGKALGDYFGRFAWRQAWSEGAFVLAPLALLLPVAAIGLSSRGDLMSGASMAQSGALVIVLGLLLYLAVSVARRTTPGRVAAVAALTFTGVLAAFTVRAAWHVSYYNGDTPVEMLVYTQTSPQVPRILDEIEEVGRATGLGLDLPVTVDASEGFTWPWAWYLRDYKRVDYPALANGAAPGGMVLLLSSVNERAAAPHLTKYGAARRFPHRWWFPEDGYRAQTLPGLIGGMTDPATRLRWWKYFMYRELPVPLGSSDALVYMPKDVAIAVSAPAAAPPVAPAQPDEYGKLQLPLRSEQTIGRRGTGAGAFEGPKGIAVDAAGNTYVADSLNHRVQKLDPAGRVLATLGKEGDGEGEFKEPWGVALDAQGNLYVADTWNHRIQKFDRDLKFVTKWGEFQALSSGANTILGKFFGPRALAFDADGNLLVTDAGNKRVQKFTPDGRALAGYGGHGPGRGQFSEPIGIAVAVNGDIYVADTWNRRIQRFDKNFTWQSEFPVRAWPGEGILNKPYLALDGKGNIYVTDPENHRVLRFDPAGMMTGTVGQFGVDGPGMNYPTGIAVDTQGRVYVAEAANHRLQRFPPFP